jgi:hypothetical protein
MLKIPEYRYLPVFWWRYIGIRDIDPLYLL